ncbi:unnamed protein product [Laminaria digitata]
MLVKTKAVYVPSFRPYVSLLPVHHTYSFPSTRLAFSLVFGGKNIRPHLLRLVLLKAGFFCHIRPRTLFFSFLFSRSCFSFFSFHYCTFLLVLVLVWSGLVYFFSVDSSDRSSRRLALLILVICSLSLFFFTRRSPLSFVHGTLRTVVVPALSYVINCETDPRLHFFLLF